MAVRKKRLRVRLEKIKGARRIQRLEGLGWNAALKRAADAADARGAKGVRLVKVPGTSFRIPSPEVVVYSEIDRELARMKRVKPKRATKRDPMVVLPVRVPKRLLLQIDHWRFRPVGPPSLGRMTVEMTRSDAVRTLIERGLKVKG